jgi:plastocyanin
MTAQDGPIAIQVNPFSSYTPKCIIAQVGQSVSIESSSTHPIAVMCSEPEQGAFTAGSSSTTVTLTVPGYYNYRCAVHTTTMMGNIKVIP